jgi:hypothetical protein
MNHDVRDDLSTDVQAAKHPLNRTMVIGWIGRWPFTISAVTAVLVMAWVSGVHWNPIPQATQREFGFSAEQLLAGEFWRVFCSLFITSGGWHFFLSVAMLTTATGLAEYHCGSWRTVTAFVGIHVATLMIMSLLLLPLWAMDSWRGELMATARDVGPSAGYYGCLGMALASWPTRWRWQTIAAVAAVLSARWVWSVNTVPAAGHAMLADTAHLIALALGIALSYMWIRHGLGSLATRPNRRVC